MATTVSLAGNAARFHRRIAAVIFVALVAIQAIPGPEIPSPSTNAVAIAQALPVPPEAQAILRRSCMDCHSQRTEWPWYSRVAPVSWLIARDVLAARGSMDLSHWPSRRGHSLGLLWAACQALQQDRMPPKSYLWMHGYARLTAVEKQTFCDWTQSVAVQQPKISPK
jgi:hypothetical protein